MASMAARAPEVVPYTKVRDYSAPGPHMYTKKLFMVLWAALMRELAEICWERQRMRCRRLTMYRNDPNRLQGDLRTTD